MVPANAVFKRIHILFAGIEVGVLGGLVMFAWLGLVSLLYGRTIWHPANLIATTFYGEEALRRGFRWTTLSGVALHVVVCAAIALLFGLAVNRIGGRRRILLLGMAAGIGWYFVGFTFFWRQVNPLVLEYRPTQAMFLAHVLFGTFLGTFPGHRDALQRAGIGPPPPAPAREAPPSSGAEAAELPAGPAPEALHQPASPGPPPLDESALNGPQP